MLTHPTTFHVAHFLALLPPNIPRPAISWDRDGHTFLNWHQLRWAVVVTLADDGSLHWVSLFGKVTSEGCGWLALEIPHELMVLLDCWAFGAKESR